MLGAVQQGLVNHGLGWLPVFLGKVLLEHIHIHYFTYCLCLLLYCKSRADQLQHRLYGPQRPKYLLSDPLSLLSPAICNVKKLIYERLANTLKSPSMVYIRTVWQPKTTEYKWCSSGKLLLRQDSHILGQNYKIGHSLQVAQDDPHKSVEVEIATTSFETRTTVRKHCWVYTEYQNTS